VGVASFGAFVCILIMVVIEIIWALFLMQNKEKMKKWDVTILYLVYSLKDKDECRNYIKPKNTEFIDTFYELAKNYNRLFNRVLLIAFTLLIIFWLPTLMILKK
jgi:hypothetical protein